MESLRNLIITGVDENWFMGRILFIQSYIANWSVISEMFPWYCRGTNPSELILDAYNKGIDKKGVVIYLSLEENNWRNEDIKTLLTKLDSQEVLEVGDDSDENWGILLPKGSGRTVVSPNSRAEIINHFSTLDSDSEWLACNPRSLQVVIDHNFENELKWAETHCHLLETLQPWKQTQVYYTPPPMRRYLSCFPGYGQNCQVFGGLKMPYKMDKDSDTESCSD